MHIQSQLTDRKRLSLTSLIDVTFLLLLFFMLSSTFSKYSKLEINAQSQGSGVAIEGRTNIISLDGAFIRLNGQLIEAAALELSLSDLSKGEPMKAVLTTSVRTTTQQLVDVLTELSKIDGLAITIAR